MKLPRLAITVTLLAAALAACGTSSTSSDTSPAASAVAGSSATAGTNPAGAALISSATVNVAGASVTALTDSRGYTLYYRTNDTSAIAGCTGGCAAVWPAILLPSGTPTGSTGVTGTLSTLDGGNGRQVEYNGHPLYLYANDTAAGQSKGEGIGGVWHVAATTLPPAM